MENRVKIGFIGLGSMGFPMAIRLCEAGYKLLIAVHKNHEKVEKLKEKGAIIKESFKEVILNSDIILTILPADEQVKKVLLQEEVVDNLKENQVLIEMTSCSPKTMKKIFDVYESKGVKVLDAPVSGGTEGAENGTLTLMIGGDANLVVDVSPILDKISIKKVVVGEAGAGKTVKMINQMLASIHMLAASEAFALAKQSNVDLQTLKDVIENSSGNSWVFQNKYENLMSQNFALGFRLRLMVKDINIALEEGRILELPLTNLTSNVYKMALQDYGEMDISAVSKKVF